MAMNLFGDIETGIRSFFSSLAASLSFDLIFILGIIIELAIIAFFVIKSEFSYELRMTKALDKLNKWLFVNKRLGTNNIKEFTELVKKAPKRLSHNWQQYILYREKAPSEYLSVENCIEKPLRTSSLSSNMKNLTWVSIFWAFFTLLLGIAYGSSSGNEVTGTMLLISFITPLIIIFAWVITMIGLRARKNTNLDELYQNHHLFQRFIDNACVDLPPFIDFSLLFTVEEIEKGIPALREYLESRARKEKEEFEKAKREMVVYEKYDFEEAGVDGSNILDRAMNESESYLKKKESIITKIDQMETELESLKRGFDNTQKEFQKKMQASKEKIAELRQQQEETTSRIESNYLRKQASQQVTDQENMQKEFEQQELRYRGEKKEREDIIKELNIELEGGKKVAEEAMLSEYQSFYERLCKSAYENIGEKVKDELVSLRDEVATKEDELVNYEVAVKRLEDENTTLRKKLDLAPIISEIEKTKDVEVEEKSASKTVVNPVVEDIIFDTIPVFKEDSVKVVEEKSSEVEENKVEEEEKVTPRPKGRPRKIVEEPKEKRGRGRPVGSTKKPNSPSSKKKNGRGRPKKVEEVAEPTVKRGRGRPPKNKDNDVESLNKKIDEQTNKIKKLQDKMNSQLEETISDLEGARIDKNEDILATEIDSLKKKISQAKESSEIEEVDAVSKRIEEVLSQVQNKKNKK